VGNRWDSVLANYAGKLIWWHILESSYITHLLIWTLHLKNLVHNREVNYLIGIVFD
jgi:hypothetical protein